MISPVIRTVRCGSRAPVLSSKVVASMRVSSSSIHLVALRSSRAQHLALEQVQVVHVHRFSGTENGQQNGQSHRGLRSRHRDAQKDKHMPPYVVEHAGVGYKA